MVVNVDRMVKKMCNLHFDGPLCTPPKKVEKVTDQARFENFQEKILMTSKIQDSW